MAPEDLAILGASLSFCRFIRGCHQERLGSDGSEQERPMTSNEGNEEGEKRACLCVNHMAAGGQKLGQAGVLSFRRWGSRPYVMARTSSDCAGRDPGGLRPRGPAPRSPPQRDRRARGSVPGTPPGGGDRKSTRLNS